MLDFIHDELPEGTPVSLMRQYSPIPECKVKGLDRRITDKEYDRVLNYLLDLGLTGCFQEKSSAKREYTPDFDLTGVTDAAERDGGCSNDEASLSGSI